MGARPPRLDGDELARALSAYSREPFREGLVCLIEAQPNREAIERFALHHPDRWTKMVGTLARLAGFHDWLEVDASITLDLSRLSDMELMERLVETEQKLEVSKARPCTHK